MRMVLQVLAPAVEQGDEADLGAQVPRIDGDRAQRLGRRLEQDRLRTRPTRRPREDIFLPKQNALSRCLQFFGVLSR